MPVDGPLGHDGDDAERNGDRQPDKPPGQGGAKGGDGPVRLAESRDRVAYYEALHAADGRSVSGLDQAEPPRDAKASASGWDSPELADHPDRPPPDSFRVPPDRAAHILDGDPAGGGHRHGTGRAGKTEFPASWNDQKIIGNVADVARNPDAAPVRQAWNDRWQARGVRDEVDIVVIVERDGTIWSGWPLEGGPGVVRNPKDGES
jgi:Bacterial EndoU nuclease